MSNNLPFIWRRYYRNEPTPSEKVLLDVAHERARQYLSRASASKLLHAHRGATDCGEYRKAAGFAAVGCPLWVQKRTSFGTEMPCCANVQPPSSKVTGY